MANSLVGLDDFCVWATRPKTQNVDWLRVLQLRYKQVLDVPLMAIKPIESDTDKRNVIDKVMRLDEYTHCIFVSQNAVNYAFEWIENYWPQLPLGLNYYAVGGKTAKLLSHYVRSGSVFYADGEMTSEELVSLPRLAEIRGDKILIFRGVGGRASLGDMLEAKGAKVEMCELYHRSLPEVAVEKIRSKINIIENTLNIIPVFSVEAFNNFIKLIADTKTKGMIFIAPSKRVQHIILNAGYHSVVVAENATEDEMLRAIESCF